MLAAGGHQSGVGRLPVEVDQGAGPPVELVAEAEVVLHELRGIDIPESKWIFHQRRVKLEDARRAGKQPYPGLVGPAIVARFVGREILSSDACLRLEVFGRL